MNDETKELIFSVFESSLEAQLRAVRRRQGEPPAAELRRRKGLSQVEFQNHFVFQYFEVLTTAPAGISVPPTI